MTVITYVIDALFLVTLVLLAFIPKREGLLYLWIVFFALNLGIRGYLIYKGHTKDQRISKLEDDLNIEKSTRKNLEKKLGKTAEMAAPPTLSLLQEKVEITKTDSGYTALLIFKPSKNKQLGQIALIAKVIGESSGKIVDFWPRAGPAFLTGEDSKKISADGKKARLIFQLIGVGNPHVELKMSEASKVLISGSHDLKALIIDIR